MSQKPYLSKAHCTLFDFYSARELQELTRSMPQVGFTVQRTCAGQVYFYARDKQGRKQRLSRAIAEESYRVYRMHFAEQLLEEGRLNSAGVTVKLAPRKQRVLYYQDRRDGKGLRPIDGRKAYAIMAAYRQFQIWVKEEATFWKAMQLAREYLPEDCFRASRRLLQQGEARETFSQLLRRGTLQSLQEAVQIAQRHLGMNEVKVAKKQFHDAYVNASLDDFASFETGIVGYSSQSPLELGLEEEEYSANEGGETTFTGEVAAEAGN